MVYGYVRVSSREQNEDRQLIAMHEMQVPASHIYVDKQSGKDFNRPAYRRLIRKLKTGDLLYVKSIDRLGRNYADVIEQWRVLTKAKGADICVIDMPLLDTRREKNLLGTFISDLVLALLSYVSENERDMIRRRQREGIEAAKRRGVRFGRPGKPLPEGFEKAAELYRKGLVSCSEAAKECGMAKTTFYTKVRKQGKGEKKTGNNP
jgi:DNA invertase Pin-like site-specific DNA recombinase